MNDQRGVWLAIASTLSGAGFVALIPGIVSPAPLLLAIGGVLLLGGAGLFIWLLRNRPIAAQPRVESTEPLPFPVSNYKQEIDSMPQYPTVAYPSSIDEMYRLGPTSWLGAWSGTQTPEVTLRVAIALPALNASLYSADIATSIRGEPREQWLRDVLEESSFTMWLNELRSIWHWDGDVRWEVFGSGQPDLTQLVYQPHWGTIGNRPLVARCGVLTGWRAQATGGVIPAIRVAFDVMLNLLELDAQRRPSSIRHQTTEPPAPAALKLDELAEYLVELMATSNLAATMGAYLLPTGRFDAGCVGAWVELSGVEFHRVVDVANVNRVTGAVSAPGHIRIADWPLPGGDASEVSIRKFVADFMDEMLEHGGYRGIGHQFDWLRGTGASGGSGASAP